MCQHPKDPVWNTGVPQRVHCTVLLSMPLPWEHSNQITVMLFQLYIFTNKSNNAKCVFVICNTDTVSPKIWSHFSNFSLKLLFRKIIDVFWCRQSFSDFWNMKLSLKIKFWWFFSIFDPTFSSRRTLNKKMFWRLLAEKTLLQKWGHANYAAVGN